MQSVIRYKVVKVRVERRGTVKSRYTKICESNRFKNKFYFLKLIVDTFVINITENNSLNKIITREIIITL